MYVLYVAIILQALTYACWADKANQGMNLPTGNESSVVCALNYVSRGEPGENSRFQDVKTLKDFKSSDVMLAFVF